IRPDLDRMVAGPGYGSAHAPEVEARADLLGRLVQRVVHFLAVDLGHDVERGFGCHGPQVKRPAPARPTCLAVRRIVSVLCRDTDADQGPGFRYPSLCGRFWRRQAGCPSGQRERSVKPSAQPTLVRTQHLPLMTIGSTARSAR